MSNRRNFLKAAGMLGAAAAVPASIERALAIPARRKTGTIKDVKHIVILMQENRSFDHYFGTMKGVRGFGDRHTVPLPDDRDVWAQSNGARILPPFHLDTEKTNGMKVPGTPHSFSDAQAAWNQGSFGLWPKFKTDYSMGYYRREDIPFQFALAEAFTICDAYHCSITTGTDPNRIVFWSGSNFDPSEQAAGRNCRDDKSEPNNLRCWVKGALPEPGYTYAGNPLEWETIPEVLEAAGIDWRIYQDPNDNWTGAMHGGLAFPGFRNAKPGDPIYERGMRHWSLEQLEEDVKKGTLPAVSWILPPKEWSEHPSASTPIEGAEYTARVLDALTSNPDIWASTVFFQTFDENDGLFDHLPPPAPPSFNPDGTMAGKATFDLTGEYFDDHEDKYTSRDDVGTGTLRPWGLGPRVPMYVVSPWSKGGWVNSETFDHTAVGRFIEQRFDVTVPAISPWHRKMCGDLTSCFDFSMDGDRAFPPLPDASGSTAVLAQHLARPKALPPRAAEQRFQERGLRRARPLGYSPQVDVEMRADIVTLRFLNEGTVGTTFHVYDRHQLNILPRRYAVEVGKQIDDQWTINPDLGVDLYILGPNGFMRSFRAGPGKLIPSMKVRPTKRLKGLDVTIGNLERAGSQFSLTQDAYGANDRVDLKPGASGVLSAAWRTDKSHGWYDFAVLSDGIEIRLAGKIEDGSPSFSDPLMAV